MNLGKYCACSLISRAFAPIGGLNFCSERKVRFRLALISTSLLAKSVLKSVVSLVVRPQ